MNNPGKIIFGSLVGSGIGVAVSKYLELQTTPTAGTSTTTLKDDARGFMGKVKARWEQAKVDGDVAREVKEEQLRAYFRQKVEDPTAMRNNPTM